MMKKFLLGMIAIAIFTFSSVKAQQNLENFDFGINKKYLSGNNNAQGIDTTSQYQLTASVFIFNPSVDSSYQYKLIIPNKLDLVSTTISQIGSGDSLSFSSPNNTSIKSRKIINGMKVLYIVEFKIIGTWMYKDTQSAFTNAKLQIFKNGKLLTTKSNDL